MSPLWSAVIRALGRDDLSIRANELPELTQTEIDSALTVGLLRPGERPDVTTCTACDEPHPVGIDWIMTPSGEALGALECETASTTTVTEPDVRTLQVVAPWIMSRVAEQLGAAGGIFEAAVGNYWRLGKIRRGDRSFDVVAGVGHTPVDDLVRANEKRNGEAEARDLALVPTRADGEALKRVSQRSHVVSFEGAVELVDEGLLVRQDVVVEALGITGGRRRGRVVQFNVPDGIRVADIELVLEDDKIEVSFAGRVEKRSAKDAGLTRLGRGGGKTIAFAALVEVACFGNVSIARLGASNAIGYDARVRTLRESLVALFGSDLGEFLENKGGVATPTIKVVQGRSLRVRLPGSAAWSDLSFQLLDKDKCRVAMVNSDSLYGTWSVTLWLQALDASGKTTNSRTLRQLLSNGRAMPGADHVDDALRLSHALSAHFAAEALGPAIDVGRTNVQCEFTILRAVS